MKYVLSQLCGYGELSKPGLSLFVTFSAATGFALSPAARFITMMPFIAPLFLLSCGMCALNQFQDRKTDALMKRTSSRPLPSERLKPHHALCFSLLCITGSIPLLWGFSGVTVAGLGVCALIWYNGVYTYLKKRTAFAAVPGACIGMFPPLMGWIAGGGNLFDPRAVALSALFFIWQIPHVWLLLLVYGEEYGRAGLPSLTHLFSTMQLKRIVFVWMTATAVVCLLLPLFGLVSSPLVLLCSALSAVALVGQGIQLLSVKGKDAFPLVPFFSMQVWLLLTMTLLLIEKLLHTITHT